LNPFVALCCAMLLSHFLIRKLLSYLRIAVRSRSVEQFEAARRDEKAITIDLPIQVRYNQLASQVAGGVIGLVGLATLLSSFVTTGLIIIMFGLLMAQYKQPKICELSDKGIRGPGSQGRFIPWVVLVRCEIIHDDERVWGDYFVLWDRAGRCRFNARSWITDVSFEDRDRIFRALRARFPGKAKVDRNAEPALLQAASSVVWDRDLDG
jgi:hypothetical protein